MKKKWITTYIAPIFVLLISFVVISYHYDKPSALFWDENYFIPAAYKYLNGIFFMEPHPPLGKLFIAVGEYILNPNKHLNTSYFVFTDYIRSVPPGFSFAGVRLFPVLFGIFSSVFFYAILIILSNNVYIALAFSALYLFDNSLVLQSRGAMLDSIQIFFVLGGLWWFMRMIDKKYNSLIYYGVLGIWIGLAFSVKLNSWIMVFFPGIVFINNSVQLKESFFKKVFNGIKVIGVSLFTAFLIFISIYCIHIYVGRNVINGNYYYTSLEYKRLLNTTKTIPIQSFPIALRDHLLFIPYYEKGVPAYDACKPGENGSMAYAWPFMHKTINYRWETHNGSTRYLYLIGNPLGWLLGLIGLILTAVLILSHYIYRLPIHDKRLFRYISIFFFLYSIYLLSMTFLPRVMYLYHYFISLLFSFFLICLIFLYMIGKKQRLSLQINVLLIGLFICLGVVFLFFSPLTYYLPLTVEQFQLRNWFSWWKLQPIVY